MNPATGKRGSRVARVADSPDCPAGSLSRDRVGLQPSRAETVGARRHGIRMSVAQRRVATGLSGPACLPLTPTRKTQPGECARRAIIGFGGAGCLPSSAPSADTRKKGPPCDAFTRGTLPCACACTVTADCQAIWTRRRAAALHVARGGHSSAMIPRVKGRKCVADASVTCRLRGKSSSSAKYRAHGPDRTNGSSTPRCSEDQIPTAIW